MAYDRYNKGLQDYWKTLIADEKWTEQQKFKERYEGELDEWEDYQKHLRKKARTKKTLGTIKDIAMFAAGGGFAGGTPDVTSIVGAQGEQAKREAMEAMMAGGKSAATSGFGKAIGMLSGSGLLDYGIDKLVNRMSDTEGKYLDKIGFMNMQPEEYAWMADEAEDVNRGWKRQKKGEQVAQEVHFEDYLDLLGAATGAQGKTPTGEKESLLKNLFYKGGDNE